MKYEIYILQMYNREQISNCRTGYTKILHIHAVRGFPIDNIEWALQAHLL